MKIHRLLIIFCILCLLPAGFPARSEETQAAAPKPLEDIDDIMAWKNITSSVISKDGRWFAYRLSPAEGDGQVIFRSLISDKEHKYPAGEGRGGRILINPDGRYAAFTVFPAAKEAKSLRKQKKPIHNGLALIDLADGEKKEFEKIRSFAFSGDNPSWIVMHKNPPESQAKEEDKWKGSDLILHKLGTEELYNVGNVSEFAFNKTKTRLAWVIDAQGQSKNGLQVRDLSSGVIQSLDSGKAEYKGLGWTEEGDGLTVLKGSEDEDYEDKLYSALGFKGFEKKTPSKVVYNPHADKTFPEGMTISPNRNPVWSDNLATLFFGIHEVKKKDKKDKKEAGEKKEEEEKDVEEEEKDSPPKKKASPPDKEVDKEDLPELVIWHWKDKSLQSQQQVQASRDKNFSYLSLYRPEEKKFIRLADDTIPAVNPASKQRYAIGYSNDKYELKGNLDGKRFQDIYVFDLKTGEKKLALEKSRWIYTPSPDGTHFFYYEDGHIHTYDMTSGKTYNITKDVPTSFINTEDDHNVVDPPINQYAFGWTKGGASLLLFDNWDVWHIPVHGGKGVNLTIDGKTKNIRYRSRFRFDPDEEGIDLDQPLYISAYGEWTKKAGIAVIKKGQPGPKMLYWEDAVVSLRRAEEAEVYLMTKQTYKDFPDYYLTDAALKKAKRLTEANPQQKDFLWSSGSRLIDYRSAKGDRLQAALFLPADYEEGKSYPTLVYFYEKSSQNLNRYYAPSARGFNKSVYNSRG
jgi:hypothetical protein